MLNHNNGKAINAYNPFRDMDAWERTLWNDPFNFFGDRSLCEMKTDVKDDGDRFTVEADLPGFKKEDIHLDIHGDVLTLSAERHSKHEDKNEQGKYIRCERSYGSYKRTFDISGIDTAAIKAKYTDGVLTIALPKKEPTLPESRQLEIES